MLLPIKSEELGACKNMGGKKRKRKKYNIQIGLGEGEKIFWVKKNWPKKKQRGEMQAKAFHEILS